MKSLTTMKIFDGCHLYTNTDLLYACLLVCGVYVGMYATTNANNDMDKLYTTLPTGTLIPQMLNRRATSKNRGTDVVQKFLGFIISAFWRWP